MTTEFEITYAFFASIHIIKYWSFSLLSYCRYLFCCSYAHNVAPKGKFIASVSTEAETDNPEVELKPGIDLLGPVDEIFYDTYDRYVPSNDHQGDSCYISAVSSLIYIYSFKLNSLEEND